MAEAPVGRVRTPGDATQFLDELAQDIDAAQPLIEAFEGHELTAQETEYERELCAALRRQATVEVHQHGLRITKWIPDGHGLGYHIEAADRKGRRYSVEFKYETIDRPEVANRADVGRVVLDEVVNGLVKAKQRYEERRTEAELVIRGSRW